MLTGRRWPQGFSKVRLHSDTEKSPRYGVFGDFPAVYCVRSTATKHWVDTQGNSFDNVKEMFTIGQKVRQWTRTLAQHDGVNN